MLSSESGILDDCPVASGNRQLVGQMACSAIVYELGHEVGDQDLVGMIEGV